jgi:hypothetical protein
MKRGVIIGIVVGIIILAAAGYFYFRDVSCPNYDDNEEKCLSHLECKWTSDENICEPIDMMEDEDDEDEGDVEDGESDGGINQELELIVVPDTPSNRLCKEIPFSSEMTYGKRYHCLALINNDERFCEGADTENEKNICLAHANEDTSYCEKIEGEDVGHVGYAAEHVCYFMLAVSSENADFCSEIDYLDTAQENENEKAECYYGFMSNLYQWDKSDEITTEICGRMEGQRGETCLALKARDVSMCGDDTNCLTHFEQPLSFCDEHPDFVSCMKDRAKTSKNVSICELLPQPDRDVCVGVYCTHIELDVDICATIEDIRIRGEFYEELAKTLKNW